MRAHEREIDLSWEVRGSFPQEGVIWLRSEAQIGIGLYEKEGSMPRAEEMAFESV